MMAWLVRIAEIRERYFAAEGTLVFTDAQGLLRSEAQHGLVDGPVREWSSRLMRVNRLAKEASLL